MKPEKYTFVSRNRLQNGLSLGVIVIESQKNGGTMHATEFCLEQGRRLASIDFSARQTQPEGNAVLLEKKGIFRIRNKNELYFYVKK